MFNHFNEQTVLRFRQLYVIFTYTLLTKTCNILRYWYHSVYEYALIVTYFIAVETWCQLPEDGEITPKL